MAIDSLSFATIEQLAPLLAKKEISPVELARMFLARIDALNPRVNAFLTVTPERAMADARAAERELLRGRCRGPLHGIPIALKDNLWTRGIRTTAGSLILRDFVPAEDATVAGILRRAGAVLLGKTNMHEFAYGITSENPHYGPVRNPVEHWKRISGGSKWWFGSRHRHGNVRRVGGHRHRRVDSHPRRVMRRRGIEAHLRPRQPPRSGAPRFQLRPRRPARAQRRRCGAAVRVDRGPRSTRPGDVVAAACFRDVVAPRGSAASSRSRDASSLSRPAQEFLHPRASERRQFRLARPREFFWTQLDPEVRRLTDAALESLVKGGAELVEVSLPTVAATVEPSTLIALAEAREFHQNAGYFPARSDEYGDDVRARLAAGSDVSAVDYLTARALMRESRAEFEAALGAADADAIVAPASPIPAPPVGSEVVRVGDAEESVRSALVRLNRPSNFTGLPALSVPCGFTQDGLPVGLQLIGRAFDESTLLAIAHTCEQQHDWSSSHPPIAELSTSV